MSALCQKRTHALQQWTVLTPCAGRQLRQLGRGHPGGNHRAAASDPRAGPLHSFRGLPALIVSASSGYRARAPGAQPFAFPCGGVSLRVRERGKEPGKSEPPSPSSARPVQRLETDRWSFRLQAPERREGTRFYSVVHSPPRGEHQSPKQL
jgi:hypothetical protein